MHTSSLIWRVLVAETFGVASNSAATWFYTVPEGAATDAYVFLDVLAGGGAHDLAGRSSPVLAANIVCSCVSAASWYRALLWPPTMLTALPIRFECAGRAISVSAHPKPVMIPESTLRYSKGSAANPRGSQFPSFTPF